MIKKIKEYFELRALYKKSKKVLVINATSTITSIKNIVEHIEVFFNNADKIQELDENELNSLINLASDIISDGEIKKDVIKEVVRKVTSQDKE